MIKIEYIEINGKKFRRTYSDSNKIIRKIGTSEEYSDAVDVLGSLFSYEETDKKIEKLNEEI